MRGVGPVLVGQPISIEEEAAASFLSRSSASQLPSNFSGVYSSFMKKK